MNLRLQISALVSLFVLVCITFWLVWMIQPPTPLPANAPETEFSAQRAFAHVREIAREPQVEILSPGNTKKEMKQKFDAYQEAGVREYWIVQPDDRNVFQYVLNEEGIFIGLHPLTDEDELVSRAFENFRIDLAGAFAD